MLRLKLIQVNDRYPRALHYWHCVRQVHLTDGLFHRILIMQKRLSWYFPSCCSSLQSFMCQCLFIEFIQCWRLPEMYFPGPNVSCDIVQGDQILVTLRGHVENLQCQLCIIFLFYFCITLSQHLCQLNTSRPEWNGQHFIDDIPNLNENMCLDKSFIVGVSLLVPYGQIDDWSSLVQVMAWHWTCVNPIPEPMIT